jgi:hypothetical protein
MDSLVSELPNPIQVHVVKVPGPIPSWEGKELDKMIPTHFAGKCGDCGELTNPINPIDPTDLVSFIFCYEHVFC